MKKTDTKKPIKKNLVVSNVNYSDIFHMFHYSLDFLLQTLCNNLNA